MCRVLKVTRSGYYDWLKRKPSQRSLERQEIVLEIKRIYQQSNSIYGSPKITNELKNMGWKVSRPRVARIMNIEGIRSITCKKYRVVTTDSKHNYPIADNYLGRDFQASQPGSKWVSDITYIPTKQGWLYLTIIIDLYDRKVVGWSLSTNMTARDTIMAAWKMATINRPIASGLLFHSDRGVQYACKEFAGTLQKIKVIQSMSRKGNCWDNAVAEAFFKILKSEMINHKTFKNILEAKVEVFRYIEGWYNRKRKHSYLGYLTPEQYNEMNYSKCA